MFPHHHSDISPLLQKELSPGEELLWVDKPKTGIIFRKSDIYLIPFGILYLTGTLLMINDRSSWIPSVIYIIWGIAFTLLGLYMTIGRVLYNLLLRRSTIYGLTTQKLIIISGVFRTTIKDINIKSLFITKIIEETNGYGCIQFGSSSLPFLQTPQIVFIPDVKR